MSDWASPAARAVRRLVFTTFAAQGRPPSIAELARLCGLDDPTVRAALRELHDLHAIVLTADGDAIRMAHPFSAWPMAFVVRALDDPDRLWWGGCAWDSFGIVAALGEDCEIATSCPGTGEVLRYQAGPQSPPDAPGVVVRLPRPASAWWDDVIATCTNIRAFSCADAATAWEQRTGASGGATVPLEQLWRLALAWYGDRLDADWAPRTPRRSQELLEATGLTGRFWALPGAG